MASLTDVESRARDRLDLAALVIAVAAAAAAILFLLIVAAGIVIGAANGGRILPGVRAGSVDVGGSSVADAQARIVAGYGALAEGAVTVETPWGADDISYQQIARGPDASRMATAALAVGRSGDPFSEGLQALRAVLVGSSVPLDVRFDQAALSAGVHAIDVAHGVPAQDASVVYEAGTFSMTPSAAGRAIDEQAVETALAAQLSAPSATSIRAMAREITLDPVVTDADAARALAEARRMAVPVALHLGSDSWTIPARTVALALEFGPGSDGTYEPSVGSTAIRTAVSGLAATVAASSGPPAILAQTSSAIYVAGGSDSRAVDVDATTANVLAYLAALQQGTSAADPQMATDTVETQAAQSGKTVVNVSKLSTWTVGFDSYIENGYGANIRLPAQYINGTVVEPGRQFSFWQGVGPITFARGFKMGGVIEGGHSNLTGAIGGGICSASTSLFNAVLHAGLQIDERHNHAYYITRYPVGLDATVFDDGTQVDDMKFTNDMANAIVIRGYSTATSVTFEIWGVPDGRTVKVTQGPKTDYSPPPPTVTVTDPSLPPGSAYWEEIPAAGFNIWAYRTVTDANGNVIHDDAWYSHYITVTGLIHAGP